MSDMKEIEYSARVSDDLPLPESRTGHDGIILTQGPDKGNQEQAPAFRPALISLERLMSTGSGFAVPTNHQWFVGAKTPGSSLAVLMEAIGVEGLTTISPRIS
jgi:hypothetical protein